MNTTLTKPVEWVCFVCSHAGGGGATSGNVVESTRNAAGNAVFSLVENRTARPLCRGNGGNSAGRGSSQGPAWGRRFSTAGRFCL
jgi:hypothetical protein